MISLFNIWTVARIEIKTLLRSWFFRIFAGLSLVLLIFFNLGTLTYVMGPAPWEFRGIPSSIPYMNILLINVVQAIIAVFLASDYLKRDKKLDTSEVIYMRSMTNGDYVIGKTIGILTVFLVLNILVLLISAIYNVFFTDVSVIWSSYLYYPILISLPTLVFILGLSFLLMAVIRNQPVTFIVLLGYIGVTLFFLSRKFHYLFDYMAFNVPLMYSDFVGFGNLPEVLTQRGIYFTLGLGFIFATILLLKRLPQSRGMTNVSGFLTVIFLFVGSGLSTVYITNINHGKSLRQEMTDLNNQLFNTPCVTPLKYNIQLQHRNEKIESKAKIVFQNSTGREIDKVIFSLNPGLHVEGVKRNKTNLNFKRENHVLTIEPPQTLAANKVDSVTVFYQGVIDEDACYIDLADSSREQTHRVQMLNIGKRYSFIEPDYVLLTPENLWYPVPGVTFSSEYPEYHTRNFSRFHLNVSTHRKLQAISQGSVSRQKEGNYRFTPEHPLPGLSLVIGNYENRAITVDSVDYNLFIKKNHDYFTPFFDEIGDTLSALIRDQKQEFEGELELPYSYSRLNIIEVPIQFFSYRRPWTISRESVQPEIVFLPEKGILLNGADFGQFQHWMERRRRRRNQVTTAKENQSDMFRRFVESTFTNERGGRRFFREGMWSSAASSSIFPHYYTFVNQLKSDRWPILNIALESFLLSRTESPTPPFARYFRGLTSEEKVNIALTKNSLSEILSDPNKEEISFDVLKAKGNYLFMLIQSQLGEQEFKEFLSQILSEYRFQTLPTSDFIASLKREFQFDLEPYLKNWYHNKQLPGYIIGDVKAYKVLDNDRTRYQIRFKVSNAEPIEGLLNVTFRLGRRGRFFGRGNDNTVDRIIPLEANQTKEVGIVLDGQPRMMEINTLISKNLPASFNRQFEDLELRERTTPFDGERILDDVVEINAPNEIVVDNEASGFQMENERSESYLKKLFQISSQDDEKYTGIRFWRPPTIWQATVHTDFYGKFVRSAYFIKAGDGDKKVAWHSEVPYSGYYDIYYHVSKIRTPWRRRRDVQFGQYHFQIYHDDGTDEVALDLNNAENGWTFLGSYYLSKGKTKVELTNESEGRIVFADAVKWVQH